MKKAPWEKDLEDWGQKLGNMFGGFLGMSFIFVVIVFFYEGCSWRSEHGPDNILSPEEVKEPEDPSTHGFVHKDFNPSDWILYKQ